MTDGQLVLRHLFGFSADAWTAGAIGTGATRTSAEAIQADLAEPDCLSMLDVDGNGQRDALTDGLLFLRYCAGRRGEDLVTQALGEGSRTDPDSIATNLDFYSLPRAETSLRQCPPGRASGFRAVWALFRTPGAATVDVRVVEGSDADRGARHPDRDQRASSSFSCPTPTPVPEPLVALPQSAVAPTAALQPYAITEQWDKGRAWFAGVGLG